MDFSTDTGKERNIYIIGLQKKKTVRRITQHCFSFIISKRFVQEMSVLSITTTKGQSVYSEMKLLNYTLNAHLVLG